MQIDAVQDTLNVQFGTTFSGREVAKLEEAVRALGPFVHLEINFSSVRQCDDAALARLAGALACFDRTNVRLHGLTTHQWRLLTYLGVHLNRH